eukprot:TRINITY_DN2407_c0_g2_i4.p1 TRINITY_DN2407_c0_g2~~TRINITY_DN2407_c0_g2_i4.p1  ORF type:complete len:349 (+),score=83.50 TRINITY_DN2407_c0_g2_i4:102-1049(+)
MEDEAYYLNFEKYLIEINELVNELNFYWEVMQWDKAFFSSVEEWRETAKRILDKYCVPTGPCYFKIEIEISKLDQQSFDIIMPLVEASLEKKWGPFQEYLLTNRETTKKAVERKSSKLPLPRPGGLKTKRFQGEPSTPKKGKLPDSAFTLKYNSVSPDVTRQFTIFLGDYSPSLKPLMKMYETIQHFFLVSNQPTEEGSRASQAQAVLLGFTANGAISLLDEETRRACTAENIEEDSVSTLITVYKSCMKILEEAWNAWETNNPGLVATTPGRAKGKYNTLTLLRKAKRGDGDKEKKEKEKQEKKDKDKDKDKDK